jgi:integrase/recombinase XerD
LAYVIEPFSRHSIQLASEGKNQKDRFVPIGMRALVWIARYVEEARDQMLLNMNERALFITIHGDRLNPDSLTGYGRSYIESAGIKKPGSCHLFRHSMATAMLENGAGIRYLQAILGHTNLNTTQIYTRTSLKKLLEVHGKTHPAERPDDVDAPTTPPPNQDGAQEPSPSDPPASDLDCWLDDD